MNQTKKKSQNMLSNHKSKMRFQKKGELGIYQKHGVLKDKTSEPRKKNKTYDIPLYWLLNTDPYKGLIITG